MREGPNERTKTGTYTTTKHITTLLLRSRVKKEKKETVRVPGHSAEVSETSLNTVVHENVRVCYMNQYVKFFLKFSEIFKNVFQKLPSAYIFYKLYKSKFVIH